MYDVIGPALFGFFALILLSYVIGSIIMMYHLFMFGLNKKTATASSIVFIVSSSFIFALIGYNLISISMSLNN